MILPLLVFPGQTVTNALAYYVSELFTAVKGFTVQAALELVNILMLKRCFNVKSIYSRKLQPLYFKPSSLVL
jgi:hypothetical protein